MPLIDLNNIHFAYPGLDPVLEGASMRLNAGERLSIAGPNGAGKSTLLKIIMGLLVPASGTVTAFGKPCMAEADFHEMRRRVGFVFQDADDQLFCPTVAEDVAFGPLNLGKSKQDALAIVDSVLTRLELMHLRDRVTHKLSGGEKRLVTLATVLAMEPAVLILDEPTNALDPDNYARLAGILKGLDQAILLVSHDQEFRKQIAPGGYRLKGRELIRT
ncbi:energy-coupling factor ABC transporter ATP-binding protein [Leisingera sp. M527]|uniref:energy-coupling factor ABC transporter ATP-binding protein n=1 Tax=unclassified Leisingera TaxID=2614906 RepID=UPI0021A3121A|nr:MULTISPECIES: ABC transporter ATP-binding protein [unclassified Leisingera]UWQ33056.1 energy-coupling factor ABC transporter ATP-binding protein [Leisingera sp. M527]UWQ74998.1 energy-coupling factor ABC transporter ATP-binding protein [Leisingera sp. M658]